MLSLYTTRLSPYFKFLATPCERNSSLNLGVASTQGVSYFDSMYVRLKSEIQTEGNRHLASGNWAKGFPLRPYLLSGNTFESFNVVMETNLALKLLSIGATHHGSEITTTFYLIASATHGPLSGVRCRLLLDLPSKSPTPPLVPTKEGKANS